jgi:phospholipid/cholesterol/gamma-HCH transport system permease protein
MGGGTLRRRPRPLELDDAKDGAVEGVTSDMAMGVSSWLSEFGVRSLDKMEGFGDFSVFTGRTLRVIGSAFSDRGLRILAPQAFMIGVQSVPVLLITGLFVGMVLAVQTVEQFQAIGLEERMGSIVNLAVLRELGPVLAGIMLAGRVGGALTAELGTMRVTEQLDALRAMGTDPIRYLVVPRFVSCLLLTPVLTIYSDLLASIGGWYITVQIYGVQSYPYWKYAGQSIEWWDFATGGLKSFLFGGALGLISCYKGFTCRPGAEGVGRATTDAFVASFMAILVLDFFSSVLMQALYRGVWGFKSVF